MADYGLKYLCEYRSKMRGKLLYRIEIAEKGAPGLSDSEAGMVRPYSEVFSIKWGNSDDAEYAAVKGSSMTLRILCVNDLEYLSLFSADPFRFRVTVYEYRDSAGSGETVQSLLWRGFLSASSYKESFARPPYVVTLSATDGFSLLGSIPYLKDDGSRYSGMVTLHSLLESCLQKLDLALPYSEWLYMNGIDDGERNLENIYIDNGRVYNMKEEVTWLDVLEYCLKPFMAQIFQASGAIHIRRIRSLRSTNRPELWSSVPTVTGPKRLPVTLLWSNRCSIRNTSELELLPPYRNAAISVSNTKASASNRTFYSEESWCDKTNVPNGYYLGNRVVIAGITAATVSMELPDEFEPAAMAKIDVSLRLANLMTTSRVIGEIAVIAKVGTEKLKWISDTSSWSTDADAFEYNFSADAADATDSKWGYRVSIYTPPSRLDGYDFKTTISNLPSRAGGENYRLYIRIVFQPADLNVDTRSLILISDIEVDSSVGDDRVDVLSEKVAVSQLHVDDCELSIPLRDGGYHLNMKTILSCPLLDAAGAPIVSWLAPTERGDLLHLLGNDILKLRSSICRQISGELQCQDPADLNTLFSDSLFTRAIYYVNSLEFMADRQVYKVQLRELSNLQTAPVTGVLTDVCMFDEELELVCALHATLFFKTAASPCRVAMYNTESRTLEMLPYSDASLSVRKGLDAVVVQVGQSALYAVDNVGNVLSKLSDSAAFALNFDTALYDADRSSWVSFKTDSAANKSSVCVVTSELELESEDEFDLTVSGLQLISSGYILTDVAGESHWHGYERHPSETIQLLPYSIRTISDSLLVNEIDSSGPLAGKVEEIRRRTGTDVTADSVLGQISVPQPSGMTVSCNCAIVAVKYKGVNFSSVVSVFDARMGRINTFSVESSAGVAVAGAAVWLLLDGRKLQCYASSAS